MRALIHGSLRPTQESVEVARPAETFARERRQAVPGSRKAGLGGLLDPIPPACGVKSNAFSIYERGSKIMHPPSIAAFRRHLSSRSPPPALLAAADPIKQLIADKAYDANSLRQRLAEQKGSRPLFPRQPVVTGRSPTTRPSIASAM